MALSEFKTDIAILSKQGDGRALRCWNVDCLFGYIDCSHTSECKKFTALKTLIGRL